MQAICLGRESGQLHEDVWGSCLGRKTRHVLDPGLHLPGALLKTVSKVPQNCPFRKQGGGAISLPTVIVSASVTLLRTQSLVLLVNGSAD